MDSMNIIYLGSFPTAYLIKNSNGKIDSLYRDDHAIIKGLRSNGNVRLHVLTIPDLPSYPKNVLYIKKHYDEKDDVHSLSLLNLPIVKHIWIMFALFINAIKYLKKSPKTIVISPYIVFHHVLPAYLLKVFFRSKIKLVLVVPDIFFPEGNIQIMLNKFSEYLARKYDGYVLYTEAMSEYLRIKNKPYIVIEGFKEIDPHPLFNGLSKFNVTYAGSLNLEYGLGRLVDSMDLISLDNIELHLIGAGNAVDYIKEKASNDHRIKYLGKMSKEDATKALYKADVLINPRNNFDGDYVAYSFPSKDIDYLGSGIPSIMCRLSGMPFEYYDYFIDAGGGSSQEIAKAILEVLNMTEEDRKNIGKKAQKFIMNRMNPQKQGEQIINMIINI